MTKKQKGNFTLLLVGLLFGVSSPLAKMLGASLSPFGVVGVRFLFAMPWAAGAHLFGQEKVRLSTKTAGMCVFLGVIFPVSVVLYTMALITTKVSIAIFSFYLANLVSSLLVGVVWHRERVGFTKAIAFVCAICAIILFAKPWGASVYDVGMMYGYASGILQTFASHYQKKYTPVLGEATISFAQILGGICIGFLSAFWVGDMGVFHMSEASVVVAILFGCAVFLINRLLVYGFSRADIGTGTLLMSSELFFGPAIAYILFGEVLTTLECLGAALVVCATMLAAKAK